VGSSSRLLLASLLALVSAVAVGSPASAAECPTGTFLSYEHGVYAAEPIPDSLSLVPGAGLGEGLIDEPTEADGCKRRQGDVQVRRIGEIDPSVAVAVSGLGSIFVLGARCSGYASAARWECLLEPLGFEGVGFAGVRYPEGAGELPLGAELGEAELGGEIVQAVRIEGVDPALAVAVEGRPQEAFLAPGACPYERFDPVPLRDDLRRCLTGPAWLVFDPPGARVGVDVTAYPDRALPSELEGAAVELVRLRAAGDVVPRDRSGAVRIGTLSSGPLAFSVPELEQGLYEAVVTCEPCATAFGGRTVFPAGSLVVLEKQEGSSGSARPVLLGLGGLAILLVGLSILAWRKGWAKRRPSGGAPAGS
jgi:hypothetical protein